MPVSIGVLRESAEGETRVALTPPVVATLVRDGLSVTVEKGAGERAGFTDAEYKDAGATLATRKATLTSQVVVAVGRPDAAATKALKEGQALLGLVEGLEVSGVHVLSLERLPRQISRAQTMDALSSQASIAGYRAAIVAATAYGRYFPMMVTAAGTAKPASVLVLGAGVAGLQAIATARRLGARVSGYDVRPAAREEVTSLGASFLATTVSAVGEGGYARELTQEESAQQRAELSAAIAGFDIVITTAKVPGRKPPELVDSDTVAAMRRGSVIVDLAAGPLGGNVAGVGIDTWDLTTNGVMLIAAGDLPQQMAPAASDAYARNIAAVIAAIVSEGELAIDPTDEVVGALLGAPAAAKEEVPA
ncbi:NAD(P) transhydrogenase subunit alpha [Demequina sp.]|uniref:NAD(P) transhydrogenase subunit alpha n=1 Tax=Demequina sp. TaxID=2050685 RepID=UPI003D151792